MQQLLPLLGDGVQLELQQVLGGGEQRLVTLRLHLLGERGQLQQVSLQQRTLRINVNCLLFVSSSYLSFKAPSRSAKTQSLT